MNPSFPFGYSPKLLESILNVGTDYICVKDPEGIYVYVNKFHASLYNVTPEEMVAQAVVVAVRSASCSVSAEAVPQDVIPLNSMQTSTRCPPRDGVEYQIAAATTIRKTIPIIADFFTKWAP